MNVPWPVRSVLAGTAGTAALSLAYVVERKLRPRHQGPLDYDTALSVRRPDLIALVRPLLMRYAQLRYGPPATATRDADVRAFRRAVERLSLATTAPRELTLRST